MNPQAEGMTFHLTAPKEQLPQVGELVESVRVWAKENLQIEIPMPIYLPVTVLRSIGRRYNAGQEAIDNAIGLMGAVSVPIYYTTPADEIALLLEKSGARWFFVGDERVKQNLSLAPKEIQVIPFGPLAKHWHHLSSLHYDEYREEIEIMIN